MKDAQNLEGITGERRDFLTTLLAIDKGQVVDQATDELAKLGEAVGRWAKKGTLTITIEIEPLDPETFAGTGDVAVTGQVKITPPRPKHASAFRLTGIEGRMDPVNPDQPITG